MELLQLLSRPWPWYVAGPAIGLVVPLLLLLGRSFGLSSSLRHMCAAMPVRGPYFSYDWRRVGGWNLLVFGGVALGGFLGGVVLRDPEPVALAASTARDLAALGVVQGEAVAPESLFGGRAMLAGPGLLVALVGGLLIGFGTRWAAGCTSGHAITGLATLQWPSLVAVVGFFVGGLVTTHLVFPRLLPALLGGTP